MTEQEQINEMTEFLDEMWIDYPPRPIEVAEALYNAGYSKDYISEERARKIGKEMFDKVRKEARLEAAKEIYRQLQGHGTTFVKKWIKNNYGVQVEE